MGEIWHSNEGDADSPLPLSTAVPPALAIPSFRFYPNHTQPVPTYSVYTQDRSSIWSIVTLLVTWLHCIFHLSHRACDLILRVFKLVLSVESIRHGGSPEVISLRTILKKLDCEESILAMPMCPKCSRIFSPGIAADTRCPGPECSELLFEDSDSNGPEMIESRHPEPKPKPKVVFPCHPISSQLPAIFSRSGMEVLVESWRSRDSSSGQLRDIMDGEVWKRLPDPQGNLFFDNRPDRAFKDELRIGLTLSMDG
jgi:hypothetical protein